MVCDPSPVMEQVQAKKKPSLRARQKELRKKQMLEAARKLFIANGYSKTSIETIAQNAEVGVATVYTYFENKENLAANLIRSDINEIFWEVSRDQIDRRTRQLPQVHYRRTAAGIRQRSENKWSRGRSVGLDTPKSDCSNRQGFGSREGIRSCRRTAGR